MSLSLYYINNKWQTQMLCRPRTIVILDTIIYSSLLHRKGSNYNKKRKITEKARNKYTTAHTSKQQSNTQKSRQTIYRKDYQPWLSISLWCELTQLISSISCKQRAQTIFRCCKFLQKSHCTSIDLWLNRRKIKIDLTLDNGNGNGNMYPGFNRGNDRRN